MKKVNIITAINNEILNTQLRENNFNVLCKDIQYQEGIFEQLEKEAKIDVIILSGILPGNMRIERVIEKIQSRVEKIKIIIILEKKNEALEDFLFSKGIYDIYYDNEIDVKTIINILNNKKIFIEEDKEKIKLINEINNLKKIIKEKNNLEYKFNNNIINIYGCNGVGKTIISIILALNLKKEKILIISKDQEILNKINNKIRDNIFISDKNINKNNYIIYDNPDIYNPDELNIIIINNNLYDVIKSKKIIKNNMKIIINKINKNSIDESVIKEILNNNEIIGYLSENCLYNKFINSQFKYKIENNKKIKNEYLQIIKKIEGDKY